MVFFKIEQNIKFRKKIKKLTYKKITKNQNFLEKYDFYLSFGLKILQAGNILKEQLESCRKVLVRYLKKKTKITIPTNLLIGKTKKPNENRMGKGKGNINFWVLPIKKGTIIFNIKLYTKYKNESLLVIQTVKKALKKLPLKGKVVFYKNKFLKI